MCFTLLLLLHLLSYMTHARASPQDASVVTAPTVTVVDSTVTTYVSAATTPASPQYTDDLTLRTAVLNSTNLFRWQHNASYISWNSSLATYAASYSAQCIWAHSHGPEGYGENLARGYPDITSAVDAWGNERALYTFGSSDGGEDATGFTEETGHFTQLVWKGTQSVGCGVYACNGQNNIGGYMLVCEYWPPGNIQGMGSDTNLFFDQNVQRQVHDGDGGFDTFSATAGATGVTGLATAGPTPTASSGSPAAGRVQQLMMSEWQVGLSVFVIAFLGFA